MYAASSPRNTAHFMLLIIGRQHVRIINRRKEARNNGRLELATNYRSYTFDCWWVCWINWWVGIVI